MGKERLRESAIKILKQTTGLVKGKPEVIGTVGAAASATSLGMSLNYGYALGVEINAPILAINLLGATVYLKSKRTSRPS